MTIANRQLEFQQQSAADPEAPRHASYRGHLAVLGPQSDLPGKAVSAIPGSIECASFSFRCRESVKPGLDHYAATYGTHIGHSLVTSHVSEVQ